MKCRELSKAVPSNPSHRRRVRCLNNRNGETLPITGFETGKEVKLLLEPFEANPQFASHYLSETLPVNCDLASYYDVRNP